MILKLMVSPLSQLSVITNEISQNFDHALDIAQQFNIEAVEVRSLWNKNIVFLSDDELNQMKAALDKHNMRLSVVCSPFAKCKMPSSLVSNTDKTNHLSNSAFNLSLFDRCFQIADYFQTKYVRVFNFIRLGNIVTEEDWSRMIEILKPYVAKAESAEKILLLRK